jgi:hypothetical protein
VCVLAASEVEGWLDKGKSGWRALAMLLGLQGLTVLFIKRFQDFG